ncbi:MAG TPA: PASTA domain-containing protein [Solirubrobacterales bacterium]|jgi:hypothetical protein|nr:PASTA domain-containing protein [Solirubrobacterales bacterium]
MAAVFVLLLAWAAPASADPALPPFSGLMSFPAITGPASPEEYSWEVQLHPGQKLEQVDDRTAEVFDPSETPVETITAEEARDAAGKAVLTSLTVTGANAITLTVHHRESGPFSYPITPGPPFEVGYSTVVVIGPPDETELREAAERAAREKRKAEESVEEAPKLSCVVPRLKSLSLRAAKAQIRSGQCEVGQLSKRRGATAATGKVVAQQPTPGTVLPAGAPVKLTFGPLPRRSAG